MKVGALIKDERGVKKYDYTHILPASERTRFRLHLDDTGAWGKDLYVRLLDADGTRVGFLDGDYREGSVWSKCLYVSTSELDDEYRGLGLGRAMYVAAYVHVYRLRKVTLVKGLSHSSMAARVHTSIMRDYKLAGYRPQSREVFGKPGEYDGAWGPYTYKLTG